jgi:hypothetical protein
MNDENHNLKLAVLNAIKLNDGERLCIACQAVFDAGLEIEALQLPSAVLNAIGLKLFEMNWSPRVRGQK